MKALYGVLFVGLSAAFFLTGRWIQLQGIWLVCFAAAAATAVVGAISDVLRLRGVEGDLEDMFSRDAPADEIRAWLMRKGLDPHGAETPSHQALIVGGFFTAAILAFHYMPWTPESVLGHIGRAIVCLGVASIALAVLYIPLIIRSDNGKAKVRDKITSADHASCRTLVAGWEAAADAKVEPLAAALGEAEGDVRVEVARAQARRGEADHAALSRPTTGRCSSPRLRHSRPLSVARLSPEESSLTPFLRVAVELTPRLERSGSRRG